MKIDYSCLIIFTYCNKHHEPRRRPYCCPLEPILRNFVRSLSNAESFPFLPREICRKSSQFIAFNKVKNFNNMKGVWSAKDLVQVLFQQFRKFTFGDPMCPGVNLEKLEGTGNTVWVCCDLPLSATSSSVQLSQSSAPAHLL